MWLIRSVRHHELKNTQILVADDCEPGFMVAGQTFTIGMSVCSSPCLIFLSRLSNTNKCNVAEFY